jgi:RNA polymerase sigma-70 factor, ECF subfamily
MTPAWNPTCTVRVDAPPATAPRATRSPARAALASLLNVPSDTDFEALLVAARDGEAWALTSLYRSLYPRLRRYLASLDPNEGEDLASETWLDLIRGLARFDGDETALRAFAFTIGVRRLADLRRRRRRQRTDPRDPGGIAELAPTGDVENEALDSIGTAMALQTIVSSLPREQAEVILLRVIGQLDAETVGTILGKRPGTVRVIQHRALRRLAAVLELEGVTR